MRARCAMTMHCVWPAASSVGRRCSIWKDPLASQPTLSRLLSMLSTARNLPHWVAAVTRLGMEHILSRTGGERLPALVIDVDAVPLDAHGSQQGSAYHGHYKRNVFLPLVITCGETGDVLGCDFAPWRSARGQRQH